MIKKSIKISLILSTVCVLSSHSCFAADFSSIKSVNPLAGTNTSSEINVDLSNQQGSPKVIHLNASDTFYGFTSATDRFLQCNIRASWEDFKTIIENASPNDFVYMAIANKMADLGLFDLAYLASTKVQDKDISQLSIDEMKRYYFPRKRLKLEDELFLAEIYSNILYNDQSSESTNELLKNAELMSNSDYANYLAALGSYRSGIYSQANQYIDIAVLQNPSNLNYQKLKAQILADGRTPTDALKVIENLKRQNLSSSEYERKVKSLEQYVLYKNSKAEWDKNYHLGYYHYLENDSSKAIRTLQPSLLMKKCDSAKVLGLMSEIYLQMNEFEKAQDTAKKAYKKNSNNPKALVSLGDLSYRAKNYKQALKYYKHAASVNKYDYIPMVKEAQAYQQLNNIKKAKELYTKVLKTHANSYEAYFNIALLEPDKKTIYLKKALAINPLFKEGWIELAKIEIEKENYSLAQQYLSNTFYIDENDFKYYYYQGLASKGLGDYTRAEYNFKKCLKLNSKFNEAQKELNNIININDTQF